MQARAAVHSFTAEQLWRSLEVGLLLAVVRWRRAAVFVTATCEELSTAKVPFLIWSWEGQGVEGRGVHVVKGRERGARVCAMQLTAGSKQPASEEGCHL